MRATSTEVNFPHRTATIDSDVPVATAVIRVASEDAGWRPRGPTRRDREVFP